MRAYRSLFCQEEKSVPLYFSTLGFSNRKINRVYYVIRNNKNKRGAENNYEHNYQN